MERIKGFDGLRALAVTSVFVGHMRPLGIPIGAIAVYFFFVLSGFLITGILTDQRRAIESNGSPRIGEIRSFYYRRALRIFPIYYLTLFLYAAWICFDTGQWPSGLWSYILYYSNMWMLSQDGCHYLLCHFWSLAIEEQFYVFLAPLLIFSALVLHMRLMLGVFAVGTLSLFLAPVFGLTPHEQYWISTTNFALLALGGIMSLLCRKRPDFKMPSGLASAAAVVVVAFVASCNAVRAHIPALFYPFFWITIVSLAVIVTWIAHHQESRVVRVLQWQPIRYLGVISYGFYLMHPATIHIYRALVIWPVGISSALPKDVLAMINGSACFGFTYLVSHLSWKYFEKPILGLRDKKFVLLPVRRA